MDNQVNKCLLLKNGDLLISEIAEIDTELGGPDCKLINPYKMKNEFKDDKSDYTMEPWLDFTSQTEMMMHSDSILTIVAPTTMILSKYLDILAE